MIGWRVIFTQQQEILQLIIIYFFKEGRKDTMLRSYTNPERLLRRIPFINRVNISVSDTDSGKDSVDVVVKVLDSWSLKLRNELFRQ